MIRTAARGAPTPHHVQEMLRAMPAGASPTRFDVAIGERGIAPGRLRRA
jgi:hypothetical protein